MQKAWLVLPLSAALTLPAAAAPSDEEMLHCAGLAAPDERLECFDQLAARSKPEPTADAPDVAADIIHGPWLIRTSRSRIDDSPLVLARVEATDEVAVGLTSRLIRPTFWIRCVENVTALGITFERAVMADMDGGGEVTFRLDDEPAFKRNLIESSNNRSLGLWSGAAAIPFIKEMLGKRTLLARVRPFNSARVLVEFEIAGIEEAVKPVRAACGW